MASSQQPADTSDAVMMEADAPDSPPTSQTQSPSASFHRHQQSNPQQSQSNTSASRTNGDGMKSNFGTPGSSWLSKKFTEEYDRAQSNVVDKNWDHTEFGDPLMQD
ncbi:uncharacterized protein BP5553_02259 [Venustampulla echinocandica]|uniref:Uncharacterized protein n=1 Tax=Venustampulla echinocandica TaxID=2656787 RepID=A0A370U3C8_9HELO|nr:uncharacterized protein BP5553_02259 [Venustampulla echinocandica]RDL42280.1 hypothetical protein BP5553_02259 [Venustampulla echinocandica]